MRSSIVSFLVVLCVCTVGFAGEPRVLVPEELPKTLTFAGVEMRHAFEESKDGTFIVEYLPEGQTLERWQNLFAIRKEAVKLSPLERAKALGAYLKKVNPKYNFQILSNSKTGEAGIDFMVWPEDESFAEFNTWKFVQAEEGWLYSYQFCYRSYSEDTTWQDFVEFMKNDKQKVVVEMMNFEVKKHEND